MPPLVLEKFVPGLCVRALLPISSQHRPSNKKPGCWPPGQISYVRTKGLFHTTFKHNRFRIFHFPGNVRRSFFAPLKALFCLVGLFLRTGAENVLVGPQSSTWHVLIDDQHGLTHDGCTSSLDHY